MFVRLDSDHGRLVASLDPPTPSCPCPILIWCISGYDLVLDVFAWDRNFQLNVRLSMLCNILALRLHPVHVTYFTDDMD